LAIPSKIFESLFVAVPLRLGVPILVVFFERKNKKMDGSMGKEGGRLTTHVLDTALGKPAVGLAIVLFRIEGERRTHLKTVHTNSDGRVDGPLLAGDDFRAGVYELVFSAGAYLKAQGCKIGGPPFLDEIPIRFCMAENGHYHVPLLLSPYGYSTYRGS
jgi:5-hydroxyisourate hydrolase